MPSDELRWQSVSDQLCSAVAWWAHAGGFVAGMLLLYVFRKHSAPARPAAARHFVYPHPSERHHYRL